MFKIAVLLSGGGSNFIAIWDNIKSGYLNCEIKYVIADRQCQGLDKSKRKGIDTYLVERGKYKNNLCQEIDKIIDNNVDLIVLSGFLSILDKNFVSKWRGKIINIHPSLLPKYGGVGMHGMNIHRAVVKNKETETGCTVHYVDDGIDTGEIIKQTKVNIKDNDSPEIIQKKVLQEEHKLYSAVIKLIISNNGRKNEKSIN